MNASESNPGTSTPCRNLRNKEMYYYMPGEDEDQFASGAYWCSKSQESVGPDSQPASKTDCCAGRGCYVG